MIPLVKRKRIGYDPDGTGRAVGIAVGQSNISLKIPIANLEPECQQVYNNVQFSKYKTDATLEFGAMDYQDNPTYQTPDQNEQFTMQFYLYPEIASMLDRTLYMVHHAIGNTGLAVEWKPTATQGQRYLELISKINQTKNLITDVDGVAPDFKFMIMVFGEYDSRFESYANAFETNMTNIISGVRTASGNASLPIFIVNLNPISDTAPVNPLTYVDTINTQIDNVIGAVSNTYKIDKSSCELDTDLIHHTQQGYHELATLILESIENNL